MIKWFKMARKLKKIWPEIIYYYELDDMEVKSKSKKFLEYSDLLHIFEKRTYRWLYKLVKKYYFKE